MFQFIQSWLKSTASPGKRAAPVSRRTAHTRVEALESRCMLAFTVINDGDFNLLHQASTNSVVITNGLNSAYQPDLSLRSWSGTDNFDGGLIPLPSGPDKLEIKPIAPLSPTPESPSQSLINPADVPPATEGPNKLAPYNAAPIVPPILNSASGLSTPGLPVPTPAVPEADLADETDSGFDKWDHETGLENNGDVKPYDDPSPRELNSVLQMLAGLKYSAAAGPESVADADSKFGGFELNDRRLKSPLSDTDGGAMAIAVSEIVDELEATPALPRELEDSLLEISVQMDRSAGRFQAFEVLTLEPASPARETRPAEVLPPADAGAVNFEADEATTAPTRPVQTSSRATESSNQAEESVAVSSALNATSDEKSNSTWSFPIALVTFGFVLQLLRDRRCDRLRSQAAAVWRRLLAFTLGKRRDSSLSH